MAAATKALFVSTPTDKALAQSEGSSIWALGAASVSGQIDELVREGCVDDAIGLVEALGDDGLSPVSPITWSHSHQAKIYHRAIVYPTCGPYRRFSNLPVGNTNPPWKPS